MDEIPVHPLGLFGVLAGQRQMVSLRAELIRKSDAVAEERRSTIARYLRTAPMVIALMEQTEDVVNRRFSVPGGSAILTDGVYYWRRDAAEYVEHYGVELLEEFLAHGKNLGWQPPRMSANEVLAVDRFLAQHVRRIP